MAQYQSTHYQSNAKKCYYNILNSIKKSYPFAIPKSLKNSIWNEVHQLRVKKVRQRYVQPKYATATYVRHIIRISYRYNQNPQQYKLVGRIQPEVYTLIGQVLFLILPPYQFKNHYLRFYLAFIHHKEWQLLVQIPELRKINQKQKNFIYQEVLKYQVGQISKQWFYIPVETESLQNAYYRLINFVLDMNHIC